MLSRNLYELKAARVYNRLREEPWGAPLFSPLTWSVGPNLPDLSTTQTYAKRADAEACQKSFTIVGSFVSMLRITWDAAAVPEGGFHIASSPAAFAKAVGKEPAGAPFHEYAMRQAGLIGTPTHHRAFSSRSF